MAKSRTQRPPRTHKRLLVAFATESRQWDSRPSPAAADPQPLLTPASTVQVHMASRYDSHSALHRQICSLTLRGSSLTQDGIPKTEPVGPLEEPGVLVCVAGELS